MQLYLVRHAEAAQGEPDELRPLTAAGREQARSLGVRLRVVGVQPDAILTSPFLRARETGNLLARELGVRAWPEERLAPGATAAAVAEAAR
ncbi:MAG: SixA phosphatase family protein, partial [Candidatus Limnocylindria bacterium]